MMTDVYLCDEEYPNVEVITKCRACHSEDLTPLFSLGDQYVSNFVDDPEDKGILCPISLVLCNNCTLVQLKHTAPQDFMYSRFYWYRSGVTQLMRDALADVVRAAESSVSLRPDDIVLDIGSNDGTLLRAYTKPCIKVGVEPATNLVVEGSKGIDLLINDFWSDDAFCSGLDSYELWKSYPRYGVPGEFPKAKVITACGMFYDLPDPNQFIEDISRMLAPDGVFIAQLMCLKNMLNVNDVGNLAHEHLEFYSLRSLDYLFGKYGLEIYDIETNQVNGESYRLFVRHKEVRSYQPKPPYQSIDAMTRVNAARIAEHGLDQKEFYYNFFAKLIYQRNLVQQYVRKQVEQGKRVWVLGASTKGNVILQFLGLDRSLIEGASERSPEKWGKYTVGTGIPIYSEEDARKANPDFFLILPYAFKSEIMAREQEWHEQGGKRFIIPLPQMELV